MDKLANSLTTPVIMSGITLSFFIIVCAFIFLFFPTYRVIGITILVIYLLFGITSFSYFTSQQFGLGIPILILIISLSVILLLIITIRDPKCGISLKKHRDKSCYEYFGTPEGIMKNKNGEWCYKVGNYCVASDGTTTNLASGMVKDLKSKLESTQDSCEKRISDIKDSLKCKENAIQTSISSGPCLTTDNKWGVILPQYGKKCVSMETINKESIRKKLGSKVVDKKEDESKLDKKEIMNRYNALLGKERQMQQHTVQDTVQDTVKGRMIDNKYYDGSTDCYPVGTDFSKICKNKYGKFYSAELPPSRCSCPLKDKSLCDKNVSYHVKCYCELDKEKQYTDCKPIRSDFNYWCQVKYGRNYGYKKILKGRDGCCGDNMQMARAECSTSAHDGYMMYRRPTKCIPTNNYFKHLEECQREYRKAGITYVKGIGGYNCNPGYYKSLCVEQKL